jgi:hypothetical protein
MDVMSASAVCENFITGRAKSMPNAHLRLKPCTSDCAFYICLGPSTIVRPYSWLASLRGLVPLRLPSSGSTMLLRLGRMACRLVVLSALYAPPSQAGMCDRMFAGQQPPALLNVKLAERTTRLCEDGDNQCHGRNRALTSV